MSYWESSIFKRIYKKWQKRRQRGNFNGSVLETARREYYQTVDSVEMVKPKDTRRESQSNFNVLGFKDGKTFKKDFKDRVIEQIKEEPPEDPIIKVAGTSMRESKWKELMQIQREKGTAPTLSPDQQLTKYLLSLFRDEESN